MLKLSSDKYYIKKRQWVEQGLNLNDSRISADNSSVIDILELLATWKKNWQAVQTQSIPVAVRTVNR